VKLLFIDHECHKKTRSAEFFLSVVRKAFDVVEHYYSHYYRTGSRKVAKDCDVAVIWEFPISRWRFFFPGKRNVFVPMYDNEWASYWQWKRIAWSGMGVISFCDKVSQHARRCGVTNILDVRYFPDPADLPQENGDSKRVFLWERGEITRSVAEKLFPPSDGYVFDVKRADEFLERDAYLARIAKCGIVIAPRRKEGIGMAFLEAMAMGKCVVANDDATMNEYIEDGENGILFSSGEAQPVSAESVSRVIAGVGASAARLQARWRADSEKINDFTVRQEKCKPSLLTRVMIVISYPLYLLEGAWHVLSEHSSDSDH
jgi:hypothetical protein